MNNDFYEIVEYFSESIDFEDIKFSEKEISESNNMDEFEELCF